MTADLLALLVRMTLASSLAVALVFALRQPLRARFGAHVAYSLWLLIPVAIGVALVPAPVAVPVAQSLPQLLSETPAQLVPLQDSTAAFFDVDPWLLCIWIAGATLCVTVLTIQQRKFIRNLGHLAQFGDRVWRAENVTSCPALIGAWRPRIVLPEDFDERYTSVERKLILAHERTHIARADVQINLIASAMRCVFWFNPLFHIAASRFRFDQELACDASVIARFPEARRSYADAMLKTQLADVGLPVGCHWQSSHPLKERISMLKTNLPSRARRRLGAVLATIVIAGATAVGWAEQPKRILSEGDAQAGDANTIQTDLVVKIDGKPFDDSWRFRSHTSGPGNFFHRDGASNPQAFTFGDAPGKPFTLAMTNGTDAWEMENVSERLADGRMQFASTLQHNGKVVANPKIVTGENQPAGIKIGEEDSNGVFKGFEAQVMLARTGIAQTGNSRTADVNASIPTRPVSDRHASYRSISRIAYPDAQARAGIGATVLVLAHISAEGKVVSTEAKAGSNSGDAFALRRAALEGVQRWTFNPATRDGKPVASDEIVPVVFSKGGEKTVDGPEGALDPIRVNAPEPVAENNNDRPPTENTEFRKFHPPKYPPSAIVAHQSGKIILKVLVDENGLPLSAEVEKSDPPEAEQQFGDASIAAVMQWTFNPGMKDGKAYAGYVLIPFEYNVTDDES